MKGFSIEQRDGRYWFVSPAGRPFLSYGICCVNRGTKPQDKKPLNPSYCSQDHYGTDQIWAKSAARRMANWGFNTVGAWSDHELLRDPALYQTPVLHLSATGIPWVDPWDKEVEKAAFSQAKSMIDTWKTDPNVIGYFSDNELGWWIGAIFEWAFKYKPHSLGRIRFVDSLRTYYKSWDKVCTDFQPEGALSFDDLVSKGRLFLKPNSGGMRFVRHWLSVVADRYYELCRDAIRNADANALFLGDRYISNYYPEVAKAASKYADVISTNLNADWNTGVVAPFYLDSLFNLCRKPILITEFYAAAMENSSGNTNDSSGFPTVKSQKDRSLLFSRQVSNAMSKPYVLGMHWFQYYDEGRFGRDDGENYNMGLVDINDQPYALLTRTSRRLFAKADQLRAPVKSIIHKSPIIHPYDGGDLSRWNIESSCLTSVQQDRRGDAFMSWNETGIYLALYWYEDRFFESLYKEVAIPTEDFAAASIQIDKTKISVTFDGVSQAKTDEGIILKYLPGNGNNGNTRNTAILRIPSNLIGKVKLKEGDIVQLSICLNTRGHAYSMEWKVSTVLGDNR